MAESEKIPSYPQQVPIDAYGNGGFRFADMSHRGSLLCLPDGMHGWDIATPDALTPESFRKVIEILQPPAFLLLGTSTEQVFPSLETRRLFADAGLGLEVMTTGAACRTYNVLLAEHRSLGAALIAAP